MVNKGGQAFKQPALQLDLSGSSLVNIYRVMPLPSTRILPNVGSVATLIVASPAAAAGAVVGAGAVIPITLPSGPTTNQTAAHILTGGITRLGILGIVIERHMVVSHDLGPIRQGGRADQRRRPRPGPGWGYPWSTMPARLSDNHRCS